MLSDSYQFHDHIHLPGGLSRWEMDQVYKLLDTLPHDYQTPYYIENEILSPFREFEREMRQMMSKDVKPTQDELFNYFEEGDYTTDIDHVVVQEFEEMWLDEHGGVDQAKKDGPVSGQISRDIA